MKKIGFLINSLGKGGAERVAVNLAAHFQKKGYEILLVTSRRMPAEYEINFPVKRRMLEEEVEKKNRGRFGRIFARVNALRRIWKEEKPDVILSFIGKLNLYAILSARGLAIPIFLSVRSDPVREYPTSFQRKLACMLFQKARGIVFQTVEAMAFFPKKLQEKSVVLSNPLDARFLKERYRGERRREIVMAGRLDENKNHRMVLSVLARLLPDYPDLRLTIYGSGVEGSDTGPALRKQAEALGIADNVSFEGICENLYEKMEKALLFVLASGYEGMPNVLLEAMALGLSVISTDCPCYGPRAVIKDKENGLLVPVGDKKAMEQAIRKILDDKEFAEKLGENASHIGKELAPEKVCEAWRQWIEGRCEYVGGKP